MRLSELLHSEVVDADGRHLGAVQDVLVSREEPLLSGHIGPLKVEGLVVGGSQGIRLGYERGGTQGPWPISALFRRLGRRARFVPLDAVAAWEDDRLRLGVRVADLEPPPRI